MLMFSACVYYERLRQADVFIKDEGAGNLINQLEGK
ncbi:MAG: hypothetical protein JWP37_1204 [Mucilaginibacter sp.]|nr:hypothetical protein [Mucilaginibacter sp.]